MRRHFISLLTLLAAMTTNVGAQNLDKWKAYMAYGKITDIEPAGNMVYVLSSGDLFSYNITDGSTPKLTISQSESSSLPISE